MNYPPANPSPARSALAEAARRARLSTQKISPPLEQQVAKPQETPAIQEVDSGKSWAKQQLDDAVSIVTGLPVLIWNTAKQYRDLDYGAVLDGLVNDPKAVAEATKRSLGDMFHAVTEHYRDSKGEATLGSIVSAPVRRPLLVGLDALTALSLGAAAGVRTAGVAGKIAGAGDFAKGAAFAEKWANAFRAAGEAPGRIVGKGLQAFEQWKPIRSLQDAIGMDAESRPFLRKQREVEGDVMQQENPALHEMIRSRVPQEYWQDVQDISNRVIPYIPEKYPPAVRERIEFMSEFLQENIYLEELGKWKAESGPITLEMADGSTLKRLQAELIKREVAGAENMDVVRQWSDRILAESDAAGGRGLQKHLYWKHVDDHGASVTEMLDEMFRAPQVQRQVSQFRRTTGWKRGANNPDVVHAAAIRAHIGFRAKMMGWQAAIEEATKAGKATIYPNLGSIPDHMSPVHALLAKNMELHDKAVATWVNEVSRAELKHGVGSPEAYAAAWSEFQSGPGADLAADMERTLLNMADKPVMAIPKGMAKAMEIDMTPSTGFTRLYDNAMGWWRDLVLNWMPRFYINNLLGNAALMTLQGVHPSSMSGRNWSRVPHEVASATVYLEEGGGILNKIGISSAVRKARDIQQFAQWHVENKPRLLSLLREAGLEFKDIKNLDKIAEMVGYQGKALPELGDMIQQAFNIRTRALEVEGHLMSAGHVGGGTAEEIAQALEATGNYQKFLKDIEPLRAPLERSMVKMEQFLGAYGKLAPFERKYIRRVVPFWTFAKTMHQLAFWMPLIRPKTTWAFQHLSQMALDAWDDERLPSYLKGTLWSGTDPRTGVMYFSRISGFNPFETLSTRKLGRITIPGVLDPTQSPLVGAVIKLVGGYDQFSHSPPPIEKTQIVDGQLRTWELNPETGFAERVSPQTPWLDVLGDLIPQTSVLNDIMASTGFKVPGRGPKIYKMPDGTVINPRHWAWGISRAFGFSIDSANLENARAQHRAQAIKTIKKLARSAARDADPSERAKVMKVALDALRALNRPRRQP